MTIPGFWPVVLTDGDLVLRPLRWSDRKPWREIRTRNVDYLTPWDATMPPEGRTPGMRPPTFTTMLRIMRREAREGRALPFALEYQGKFVGQLTVGSIWGGSSRGAYFGYWIDQAVSGHGLMTRAVALATDYCLNSMHMHRIEINIRPENNASRAVAEKCGYHVESFRPRYLHIDGEWRDHVSYVRFRDTPE